MPEGRSRDESSPQLNKDHAAQESGPVDAEPDTKANIGQSEKITTSQGRWAGRLALNLAYVSFEHHTSAQPRPHLQRVEYQNHPNYGGKKSHQNQPSNSGRKEGRREGLLPVGGISVLKTDSRGRCIPCHADLVEDQPGAS